MCSCQRFFRSNKAITDDCVQLYAKTVSRCNVIHLKTSFSELYTTDALKENDFDSLVCSLSRDVQARKHFQGNPLFVQTGHTCDCREHFQFSQSLDDFSAEI